MKKRIHIFGASGSGTTTLAKALSAKLDLPHYDTDSFFWLPTDPPFLSIRERPERQALLRRALDPARSWILSGSLCGWGDFTIPLFNLVVFLCLPTELRMKRLRYREVKRYGANIEKPDHPMHKEHKTFLQWAAAYDTGGLDMRSRARHEEWIHTLPYPVLRIEGDHTVKESLSIVLKKWNMDMVKYFQARYQ